MEGFYRAEVLVLSLFEAFLSLSFAVSEKCPFLFHVVIRQNDSRSLSVWAQALDRDLQDLSSFPALSHRFYA